MIYIIYNKYLGYILFTTHIKTFFTTQHNTMNKIQDYFIVFSYIRRLTSITYDIMIRPKLFPNILT